MIVFTSKREAIQLVENPFASGGEGAVYKVISSPKYSHEVCVKIYHAHVLNKEREERIKYMVLNPPQKIRDEGFLLGWPMDWVTDEDGKFLGFVMPMGFPDSKELVTLTATSVSKKLCSEWHDRYDRSLGKPALVARLKLICNIAIPVHILHSTGKYVLKDFKPQNVLVTSDGRITMVDMDSIQIVDSQKLLFAGTAATPEYMPPEFYTKGTGRKSDDIISPSWDSFAIGVVFYQLLFGIHPYVVTPKVDQGDGANDISHNISSGLFPFGVKGDEVKIRPKLHDNFLALPDKLQELFMRTFSDESEKRPAAEEWGRYLHDVVVDADNNDRKNNDESRKKETVVVQNNKVNRNYHNRNKEKKPTKKNRGLLFVLLGVGVVGLSIFVLFILFVLFALFINNKTNTNSNHETVATEVIADPSVMDSSEDETQQEEFQTRRISMKTGSIENPPSCDFIVDYPVSGHLKLVNSIRQWINKTWQASVGGDIYSQSLEDGNNMVQYYFDDAKRNSNNVLEVKFRKEYETAFIISYLYWISQYEIGAAHGTSSCGGATFKKSDGRIVDWGMFQNNSDLQYIIKAGLEEYFGSDRFGNEHIPLPNGYPVLLSNGVKFVYQTYELPNTSHADGQPEFNVSYSKLKGLMTSSLQEIIEK